MSLNFIPLHLWCDHSSGRRRRNKKKSGRCSTSQLLLCLQKKKKCHHKFVSAQRFSLSTFTIDTLTTKRESERENDDAWYYYYFKGKHRKLAPKSDFHLLCPFSNLPRLIRNFKLSICLLCSAAAAARHHLQNGSRIWHQFHGWWCRRRSSNAHHMLFKYTHKNNNNNNNKRRYFVCVLHLMNDDRERSYLFLYIKIRDEQDMTAIFNKNILRLNPIVFPSQGLSLNTKCILL